MPKHQSTDNRVCSLSMNGKCATVIVAESNSVGGMPVKIILDDRRHVPSNSPYNVVRNYEDCVEMIRLFRKISFISLDYDLGEGKTGYDVLVYMAENNIEVKHINIHSDHSVGVPKMREYVWEHFPNVSLTFNPLNF